MSNYPRNLLLDTNVWIENYLGERGELAESRELIDYCLARNIHLFVSAPSLKDVYYGIDRYLKAKARNEGLEVTEAFASAVEQIAWKSTQNLMGNATVVPLDTTDLLEARRFYELHRDFEDDLILAAAQRAKADYLVTSDKKLLSKAVVPTATPGDMIALLRSFE